MKASAANHTSEALTGLFSDTGDKCVLGPSYRTWRRLQHGQEKITRFNRYLDVFGHKMRHQNGDQHRASVCFLFTDAMIRMSEYCELDQLLLTRCINHHDEPEGITGIDTPCIHKTDNDDLVEYLVFACLYEQQGPLVWKEMQRSFLLQFCLTNPACFPDDARQVMADLARTRRHEALFFEGVQRVDYLYYAYECFAEHGIVRILHEVANNQLDRLDTIADQLPGFRQVVWTAERSDFLNRFVVLMTPEPPTHVG
ncbi:MAG: hypothetical protein WCV82_03085 [Candidatus Paceibacterota bacterium]